MAKITTARNMIMPKIYPITYIIILTIILAQRYEEIMKQSKSSVEKRSVHALVNNSSFVG